MKNCKELFHAELIVQVDIFCKNVQKDSVRKNTAADKLYSFSLDSHQNSDNKIKHRHADNDTEAVNQNIGQLTASSFYKKLVDFICRRIKNAGQKRKKEVPEFFPERKRKRTKQNSQGGKLGHVRRLSDNELQASDNGLLFFLPERLEVGIKHLRKHLNEARACAVGLFGFLSRESKNRNHIGDKQKHNNRS